MAELAHGQARGDSRDFVLLWADEGIGSAIVLGGQCTGARPAAPARSATCRPRARRRPARPGRYANHGYQALTGGPAVMKLLRSYGVRGTDFRAGHRERGARRRTTTRRAQKADDARAGLRDIAARLAVGLAAITSVLDPGLIVLTGGVLLSGGEPLRELVEHELHALTIPRPPLRLQSVDGNPVLAGALDLALGDHVATRSSPDGPLNASPLAIP